MDKNRLIPITKQESDKLQSERVAMFFDAPESMALGFFEADDEARKDIILVIRDDGYYIRAREDLVKSKDEIFVGFVEDGTPPEFEDVFEVREL